jgi:hypothetical protein
MVNGSLEKLSAASFSNQQLHPLEIALYAVNVVVFERYSFGLLDAPARDPNDDQFSGNNSRRQGHEGAVRTNHLGWEIPEEGLRGLGGDFPCSNGAEHEHCGVERRSHAHSSDPVRQLYAQVLINGLIVQLGIDWARSKGCKNSVSPIAGFIKRWRSQTDVHCSRASEKPDTKNRVRSDRL